MEDRAKRSRKWGSACLNCRKKKVRCDGGKPQCNICIKVGDDCTYKASDALNSELASEIRRKDDEIDDLKGRIKQLAGLSGSERDAAIAEVTNSIDDASADDITASASSPADTARFSELSVDDGGHVRHHGATSRFHWRPYTTEVAEPDRLEEDFHRRWLRSNARFQPAWEARAMEKLAEPPICNEIDPTNSQVLLEVFWTWQAPLHNYVYRRCFYRDMALGGPYFSKFLLYVLFAHAGRHITEDDPRFPNFGKGEAFLSKAKQLLVNELETPKIPTIQGLLVLGGRQSAIGKTSEGWLYTSMAIAMIKDLGLHVRKDGGALMKDLEPDDLEARKRLFLSAYIWDKSLSLCVGRQPSLPETPYSADCLRDDADNVELWSPRHLDNLSEHYPQPTYSHNTENFTSFVRLATVINQVYAAVYGNQAALNPSIVYSLEEKLRSFYRSLPRHLKFDYAEQAAVSPPPHIVTVNILYHTALILLFRPFYQSTDSSASYQSLTQRAHEICKAEATAVNSIFEVYGRTFRYRNQTYLLSYCVYTAATVDVHGMQSSDPVEVATARDRLNITLRMLDTEAEQTPGIRRSVDIIRSQIAELEQNATEDALQSTPFEQANPAGNVTTPAISTQSGVYGMRAGFAAPSPQPIGYNPLPTPTQSTNSFAGHHAFLHPFDPMLPDQSFANPGDMSWFDWSELDISGGFAMNGFGNW